MNNQLSTNTNIYFSLIQCIFPRHFTCPINVSNFFQFSNAINFSRNYVHVCYLTRNSGNFTEIDKSE